MSDGKIVIDVETNWEQLENKVLELRLEARCKVLFLLVENIDQLVEKDNSAMVESLAELLKAVN